MCRITYSITTILALCSAAVAEPPEGISNFPETAVAVINRAPETIEKDGRKFRVLLQDVETKEIKPKIRTGSASGFFLSHQKQYYFVTAQHVAKILNPDARLGFVNPKGESRQFILGKLVGKEGEFCLAAS